MADDDLHMMVGEIRTDVRWLRDQYSEVKAERQSFDKRLRRQERKSSWIMGAGLMIAALAAKAGFPDLSAGLFH
jgi:hypothetical protein